MSIPGHRQGTLQSWEGQAKSSNSPHQISLVGQRCSQVLRITVAAKEAAVAPAVRQADPQSGQLWGGGGRTMTRQGSSLEPVPSPQAMAAQQNACCVSCAGFNAWCTHAHPCRHERAR